MLRYKTKN